MNGKLKRLLQSGAYTYSIILLGFGAIALAYREYGIAISLGAAAVVLFVASLLYSRIRAKRIAAYIRQSVEALSASAAGGVPYPMLTFRMDNGELLWHNKQFQETANLSETAVGRPLTDVLPGFETGWLRTGKSAWDRDQQLRGSRYLILGNFPDPQQKEVAQLHLIDATELLQTRDEYLRTRPVTALILIDNYDELTNNLQDAAISTMNAALNECINRWTESIGGLLRKLERNRYLFLFEAKDLYRVTDGKFSLLDDIRQIANPAGVAATISIGMGKDGQGFQENYDFAALALEMALSRGGDQAVIKDKFDFAFYGGRAKETERRTKVKARVVAASLAELIGQSSRVFIMGHRNADVDAIGAAVGLCALCRKKGKKANIVVDLRENAAGKLIASLRTKPEYKDRFISPQDAVLLADAKSLLIVVDTNRPDQVESKQLLTSMNRVAVIDHHRRAADYIESAALNFHEPFASSAAELVTEVLMYAVEPRDIIQVELEALLAGIVLDTKNFTVRVNSRTFEAAAFLRRLGADTVDVKRLFQSDFDATLARYRIVQSAKVYKKSIAVAAVEEQVLRSLAGQAADELLNIDGIDTSFVIFPQEDAVFISGRAIGAVNVQMVLEPLGGGGNAAAAGAQLRGKTVAQAQQALIGAIDQYYATES